MAGLVCASTAPSAAAIQPSRADARAAQEEVRIAREIAGMAACLVDADYHLDAFLSTIPGTSDSGMPMNIIRDSNCASSTRWLAARDFQLRGAIAELLLLRDYPAPGAPPRRAPVRIFAPVDGDFLAGASPYARTAHAVLALGDCVRRADGDALYALFRSAIGSAEEAAAFTALAPVIGTCLPAGETIRANVRTLRPFFAEAAYRAAALDEPGR